MIYTPQKTLTAYKLFRVSASHKGELFPLFVGAREPVPLGEWVSAKLIPPDHQGKITSKLGSLAYRPGWHSGDMPVATHIGLKGEGQRDTAKPRYRNPDYVWALVEVADDVDWQTEAYRRAKPRKGGGIIASTAHLTDCLPAHGFYRYKTNPNMTGQWIISGELRILKVLTDDEVTAVNDRDGVYDLPRQEPLDLSVYGF